MNKANNDYRVKYRDAKHIMDIHLYGLQGHKRHTPQLHSRVIQSLLSSLISGNNREKYFCCDKYNLLNWMIIDVKGKNINYAASRLQVVDRYMEQLCSHGLLSGNPLRQIKPRYLEPSWNCVTKALQSSKPLKQLEMLQLPESQRGPLYFYIQKYIGLQRSLGKKYSEAYRVLCLLDALLAKHKINELIGIKIKHIHEWLGQMQCSKGVQMSRVYALKRFMDYLTGIDVMQSNPAISVIREYGKVRRKKFHPLILTKEQITSIKAQLICSGNEKLKDL